MRIFQYRFSDCYLIKYPPESYIPPHTDPVDGRHHFRLNIELKRAEDGGHFYGCEPLLRLPRVVLFRPDIQTHAVAWVRKGTRLVLSFGVAFPSPEESFRFTSRRLGAKLSRAWRLNRWKRQRQTAA